MVWYQLVVTCSEKLAIQRFASRALATVCPVLPLVAMVLATAVKMKLAFQRISRE